jgi:hypothetical protein
MDKHHPSLNVLLEERELGETENYRESSIQYLIGDQEHLLEILKTHILNRLRKLLSELSGFRKKILFPGEKTSGSSQKIMHKLTGIQVDNEILISYLETTSIKSFADLIYHQNSVIESFASYCKLQFTGIARIAVMNSGEV